MMLYTVVMVVVALFVGLPNVEGQDKYHYPIVTAIRLVNHTGEPHAPEGRVEIQLNGIKIWGSICKKTWTRDVYNAICSMLGYTAGGTAVDVEEYGDGMKNFLLEDMQCPPNSTSLDQCTKELAINCGPEDDELAVSCVGPLGALSATFTTPAPPWIGGGQTVTPAPVPVIVRDNCGSPRPDLRLYGAQGVEGMGYVQAYINGSWTFVCQEGWNLEQAITVCEYLCYDKPPMTSFIARPNVINGRVPHPVSPLVEINSLKCNRNGNPMSSVARSCEYNGGLGTCEATKPIPLAGVQCLPVEDNNYKGDERPDVSCNKGNLIVTFPTSKFQALDPSQVDLDPPRAQCDYKKVLDKDSLTLTIPTTSECGSQLFDNGTHVMYQNRLRYVYADLGDVVYAYVNRRYEINCTLDKVQNVTNRYQPFTLSPLMQLQEKYNFSVKLVLYDNINFEAPLGGQGSTFLVEVGDWINAAVVMDTTYTDLKLTIESCSAYPVMPTTGYPTQQLVVDKCPMSAPSVSKYDLTNYKEGFRFRAITFPGYSLVYLRCQVLICLASAVTPECSRMCVNNGPNPNGRRRREARPDQAEASVASETILYYDPADFPTPHRTTATTTPSISTVKASTSTVKVEPTTTTKSPATTTTSTTKSPPTDKPTTTTTTTKKPSTTTSTTTTTPTTTSTSTSTSTTTTTTTTTTTKKPTTTTSTTTTTPTTTTSTTTTTTKAPTTTKKQGPLIINIANMFPVTEKPTTTTTTTTTTVAPTTTTPEPPTTSTTPTTTSTSAASVREEKDQEQQEKEQQQRQQQQQSTREPADDNSNGNGGSGEASGTKGDGNKEGALIDGESQNDNQLAPIKNAEAESIASEFSDPFNGATLCSQSSLVTAILSSAAALIMWVGA